MAEQAIDETNISLAVEPFECLLTVRSITRTDREIIPTAAPNRRRTVGFIPAASLALARLGYVIRPGQLSVAEKNTASLKVTKHPTTQTELRSFLGI
jgi:hypothetical protein